MRHVEPEDLLSFGMIPEFIGRLPVVTALDALTEEEMVHDPDRDEERDDQAVHQALLDGRRAAERDERRLARPGGAGRDEGNRRARALRSMLERIMLDIMYDVPSREDIAEVTINRAVVEGKKLPLIRKKQDKDAA